MALIWLVNGILTHYFVQIVSDLGFAKMLINSINGSLSCSITGVTLHHGGLSRVSLTKTPKELGIRFSTGGHSVLLSVDSLSDHVLHTTSLRSGGIRVSCIEHFTSACYGLGVRGCFVKIEGDNEFPILDGSGKVWIDLISRLLRNDGSDELDRLPISHPIHFRLGNSEYSVHPFDDLSVECYINFPGTPIGEQYYIYNHSKENFIREIAAARTFLKHPIDSTNERPYERLLGLRAANSSQQSVLLYNRESFLSPLRFPDEPVRHKILDFFGDVSSIGFLPIGHFTLKQPSHAGNIAFAKFIYNQIQSSYTCYSLSEIG